MDRQNYIKQDTNEKTLKLQTRSFQDEGDGSVGMKIKGEVKGGGTDKTEKEKERDCRKDFNNNFTHFLQMENNNWIFSLNIKIS